MDLFSNLLIEHFKLFGLILISDKPFDIYILAKLLFLPLEKN